MRHPTQNQAVLPLMIDELALGPDTMLRVSVVRDCDGECVVEMAPLDITHHCYRPLETSPSQGNVLIPPGSIPTVIALLQRAQAEAKAFPFPQNPRWAECEPEAIS